MAKKGGNNLNIVLGVDIAGLKKGFDDAVKVTQKAGGDVEKSAKAVSDSVQTAFKKIENSSSLKQASRQMFNLAASLQAGGTATEKAFRQAIREAGHLQDEIQDLNALIQVGGPAGPFIAMNNALRMGVAGLNAVQGSMALMGVESEQLQATMVKLQAGMAVAGALKELEGMKDVWKQLNFIMKENPIFATAAVGVALIAAISAINDAFYGLSKTQKAYNDVQTRSIDKYAEEEAELVNLQNRLNAGNLTRAEQQKIINDFNSNHPHLLAGLKTEGENIDYINSAIVARIKLIRLEAQAQAARELYIENYKKQLLAEQELTKKLAEPKKPSTLLAPYATLGAIQGVKVLEASVAKAKEEAQAYEKVWQDIDTQIASAQENAKKLFNTDFESKGKPTATPKVKDPQKEYLEKQAAMRHEIMQLRKASTAGITREIGFGQTVQGIQVAIPPTQFKMSEDAMEDYMKTMRQVTIESQALGQVIRDSLSAGISNMATAMGEAIATGQNLGMVIGKSLLAAMANFMKALGEMFVKTGVAKLAFDEAIIRIGGAPLAIAAGFALIAGSAAMTAKLQQKNQPRAFADGGVIYGPTLGLMGEYAGASANPEIVAPLDKLKSLIQPPMGNMIAETRIDGRDLVILVKNTERDMSRG